MQEIEDNHLEQLAEPGAAVHKRPESRSGGGSGSALFMGLVFLLSLTALVVSVYLAYELIYRATDSTAPSETELFHTELTGIQKQLQAEMLNFNLAIQEALERQNAKSLKLEELLASQLNEAKNLAPPTDREWKLAEIEYLLRIANHRLLLEKDVRGSARLLQSADDILKSLDDFSLHAVRAQLSEEMQHLKNVKALDIQGVFLKIETLKSDIDRLPLRLPEYLASNPLEADLASPSSASESNSSLLLGLVERIGSFFEFRRYPEQGFRPLLSPDESGYLEMNLRLMLERAQMSLLKRDDVLYKVSLGSARSWLVEYLKIDDQHTQAMLASIDLLLVLNLAAELPDISGSLNQLLEMRRGIVLDPA